MTPIVELESVHKNYLMGKVTVRALRGLSLKIDEDAYTVHVRPEVGVEVAYNEIQKSPTYKSGVALRFARIKRIRYDKSWKDADTLERVQKLYETQFMYKAKRDI